MKLSSKLGLLVLATSVVGLSASHTVLAADTAEWTGKGKISFTHDETENPVETPPVKPGEGGDGEGGGEEGEVEIPTNPSTASMKIIAVSDLDFEDHAIDFGGAVKSYNALPYQASVKIDDKTEKQDMAHFVAFQDFRTDHKDNFYTISAKITKQFSQGADKAVLDGATLTYSNMNVTSSSHKGREPQAPTVPVTINSEDAQPVLVQKEAGKGQGAFSLNFGSVKNDTADKSVTLTVPGTTSLIKGDYESEVTWYITDAR